MAHRPLTAALIASLALLATGAPRAHAQPEAAVVAQDSGGAALNITFPGGTMAEFVDALKAGMPGPFNVQLRREAADLRVPPMDLKWVSIGTAFELAIPQQGQWVEIQPDGTHLDFYREFKQIGGDDLDSAPVYIIDAYERVRDPNPFKGVRQQDQPRIDVFSVERAVRDDNDVRGLLTAIDTALALGEGDRKAEIKFHPDSSLLIVRGSPDQLATISRVIERFKESGSSREDQRFERASMLADLKAELIERRADMQRAEARLHDTAEGLKQFKALAEKEMISDREMRQAETELRMNEAEFQAAQARYQAAQEKLAMLAATLHRPQTETRVYTLTAAGWKSERVRRLLDAADSISGHITGVQTPKEAGGTLSLGVDADEDGHLFIKLLFDALDGSANGGTP